MNIFRQLTEKPWLDGPDDVVGLHDGRSFALPIPKVGLRVFLAVAMVIFSLFVAAYTERMLYSDWRPVPLPWLLWPNTVILALSSVAMHWAVVNARRGRIDGVRYGLLAGGVLAFAFLAGQLLAWRELVAAEYFANKNIANAFFYVLTAVHAAHLIGGLVAWGRTTAKVRRGYKAVQLHLSVELCAVYWHFLLLIWLLLFTLLLLT